MADEDEYFPPQAHLESLDPLIAVEMGHQELAKRLTDFPE